MPNASGSNYSGGVIQEGQFTRIYVSHTPQRDSNIQQKCGVTSISVNAISAKTPSLQGVSTQRIRDKNYVDTTHNDQNLTELKKQQTNSGYRQRMDNRQQYNMGPQEDAPHKDQEQQEHKSSHRMRQRQSSDHPNDSCSLQCLEATNGQLSPFYTHRRDEKTDGPLIEKEINSFKTTLPGRDECRGFGSHNVVTCMNAIYDDYGQKLDFADQSPYVVVSRELSMNNNITRSQTLPHIQSGITNGNGAPAVNGRHTDRMLPNTVPVHGSTNISLPQHTDNGISQTPASHLALPMLNHPTPPNHSELGPSVISTVDPYMTSALNQALASHFVNQLGLAPPLSALFPETSLHFPQKSLATLYPTQTQTTQNVPTEPPKISEVPRQVADLSDTSSKQAVKLVADSHTQTDSEIISVLHSPTEYHQSNTNSKVLPSKSKTSSTMDTSTNTDTPVTLHTHRDVDARHIDKSSATTNTDNFGDDALIGNGSKYDHIPVIERLLNLSLHQDSAQEQPHNTALGAHSQIIMGKDVDSSSNVSKSSSNKCPVKISYAYPASMSDESRCRKDSSFLVDTEHTRPPFSQSPLIDYIENTGVDKEFLSNSYNTEYHHNKVATIVSEIEHRDNPSGDCSKQRQATFNSMFPDLSNDYNAKNDKRFNSTITSFPKFVSEDNQESLVFYKGNPDLHTMISESECNLGVLKRSSYPPAFAYHHNAHSIANSNFADDNLSMISRTRSDMVLYPEINASYSHKSDITSLDPALSDLIYYSGSGTYFTSNASRHHNEVLTPSSVKSLQSKTFKDGKRTQSKRKPKSNKTSRKCREKARRSLSCRDLSEYHEYGCRHLPHDLNASLFLHTTSNFIEPFGSPRFKTFHRGTYDCKSTNSSSISRLFSKLSLGNKNHKCRTTFSPKSPSCNSVQLHSHYQHSLLHHNVGPHHHHNHYNYGVRDPERHRAESHLGINTVRYVTKDQLDAPTSMLSNNKNVLTSEDAHRRHVEEYYFYNGYPYNGVVEDNYKCL